MNVPATTLCALADYFGVSTDYLLGRRDRPVPGEENQAPRADGAVREETSGTGRRTAVPGLLPGTAPKAGAPGLCTAAKLFQSHGELGVEHA